MIFCELTALEEEAARKHQMRESQKGAAIERTYEWLHTQVRHDASTDDECSQQERVSSGESQLPYLDRRLIEGGRPQLVVTDVLLWPTFESDIHMYIRQPVSSVMQCQFPQQHVYLT